MHGEMRLVLVSAVATSYFTLQELDLGIERQRKACIGLPVETNERNILEPALIFAGRLQSGGTERLAL